MRAAEHLLGAADHVRERLGQQDPVPGALGHEGALLVDRPQERGEGEQSEDRADQDDRDFGPKRHGRLSVMLMAGKGVPRTGREWCRGLMTPPLPLVHLTREPVVRSAGAPPLLLLLHGLRADEGDLIGLAPYLDGRFFIVSARAPLALGPGMYAWFDVQLNPGNPVINAEQAESSRQILIRFIGEVTEAYGTNPLQVYLLGFSQGAIISLSVLLTRPDLLASVVAMSGRILPEVLPKMAPPEALRGIPVMVVHGVADPVLPIHHGRAIRERLSALPVDLTYREYIMGHQVTEKSLADIAAWLRTRLDLVGKRAGAG